MALIGVGFRSLSMAPSFIGPVKTMIRSLNYGDVSRYIQTLQSMPVHSLREKLREFAIDHGVMI